MPPPKSSSPNMAPRTFPKSPRCILGLRCGLRACPSRRRSPGGSDDIGARTFLSAAMRDGRGLLEILRPVDIWMLLRTRMSACRPALLVMRSVLRSRLNVGELHPKEQTGDQTKIQTGHD